MVRRFLFSFPPSLSSSRLGQALRAAFNAVRIMARGRGLSGLRLALGHRYRGACTMHAHGPLPTLMVLMSSHSDLLQVLEHVSRAAGFLCFSRHFRLSHAMLPRTSVRP